MVKNGLQKYIEHGVNVDKEEILNFISLKYPKISNLIDAAWNEPDFDSLVNNLLMDSRGGTRQGFPMEITNAIFDLIKLHNRRIGVTGWKNASRTKYHDGDR